MLKVISIESYGEVGLYLGLVAIFTAILPISSENAIARSVFEENKNLNQQVFETATTVVLVMFFLILVVVWSLSGWLTESLFIVILLALVSSVLQVFINFILAQLQMRQEVVNYFLVCVLQATLIAALTIYWLPTLGVWARYVSPVVSILIVLISYCVLTKFRYAYFKLGVAGWGYVRNVGLPLAPHSLVGVSVNYIDRFVLKFLGYEVLLGFYTLSSQLLNAIQAALSSLNNAYTPWLFGRINENREPDYKSIVLILGLLCLAMTLLLSWLIPLVPPNSYSIVVNSLYLISIYIFFEGVYYLISPILYYKKLGAKISVISLISATARIGFLFIYLNNYEPNIEGMLITLVGASAVKTLTTFWVVRSQYDT
jgi:O-antigen/teichoic acid export membrane protein